MKKCPFCAEEIQDEAIKCRYCGSSLSEISQSKAIKKGDSKFAPGNAGKISFVLGLIGALIPYISWAAVFFALGGLLSKHERQKGLAIAGMLLGLWGSYLSFSYSTILGSLLDTSTDKIKNYTLVYNNGLGFVWAGTIEGAISKGAKVERLGSRVTITTHEGMAYSCNLVKPKTGSDGACVMNIKF